MRVFILGGTGSIGTAVVQELIARSHTVIALSRSEGSDEKLRKLGATAHRGDLCDPGGWIENAFTCEAVIHVAATFDEDMGDVDGRVISEIIRASASASKELRLLYTGGCWLYGETHDAVATEDMPFKPLPAFSWMVEHSKVLLDCQGLSTAIIHPAMVYHDEGGVFGSFLAAAIQDRPIEIWGTPETRWPLIERSDLARAYCELLIRPDLIGHFNAVAEEGVRVCDIVGKFVELYNNTHQLKVMGAEELVKMHGSWARGPTLDQQMSSKKIRAATGWEPEITDYLCSSLFAR